MKHLGHSALCPVNQHCSEWARLHLQYCLCSVKDWVSLGLGLASVVSWALAEVPQILTNYKEKSAEGLSFAFLVTWIIGDLFNLFGCMLEPATLPSQFYIALLYTATTCILAVQAIYYAHIYNRLKSHGWQHEIILADTCGAISNDSEQDSVKYLHDHQNGTSNSVKAQSLPIPVAVSAFHDNNHLYRRDLYYRSARYLCGSHSRIVRSTETTAPIWSTLKDPLLGHHSAPPPKRRAMLCVAGVVTFIICHLNTQNNTTIINGSALESPAPRLVLVGRKLSQVGDSEDHRILGILLGWAMATIYMGGRLPQICLNMRRGNVKGLNPCMFKFALVGNITYVMSILVSSLAWSKIQPNLPWLVDAGGCALLDTCILIQFAYFHHRATLGQGSKHGYSEV